MNEKKTTSVIDMLKDIGAEESFVNLVRDEIAERKREHEAAVQRLRFRVLFRGGTLDGKMAQLDLPVDTRIVGMGIVVEGDGKQLIYEVQDGPIARMFEKNQGGHDNLCVVANLLKEIECDED